MTHDVMIMSSSDVMLYYIFVAEQFCLHVVGLWLGVFNRLYVSLWYRIFIELTVGVKFVKL